MRKLFKNQNKSQHQEKELNSKSLILYQQIKKISIILFFLGAVVCIQITSIVYALSVTTDNTTTILQAPTPSTNPDIISYLFNNSLTSMLLSTFIIAIIGVLINKLRTFKKKLDMIEILTKSHVKMKQQADEREKRFEKRYIESNKAVTDQISQLCTKLDIKSNELEKKMDNDREELEKNLDNKTRDLERKIGEVKDNATEALINYLKENSLGRKR